MAAIARIFAPARILHTETLGAGYGLLCLAAPHLAAGPAGSFTLLSVHSQAGGEAVSGASGVATDPFLPRPFSFLSRDRTQGRVEIFYRVVGRGTSLLSKMHTGETLMALGPLGRGWRLPSRPKVALIAGGVGMPPLLDLCETLHAAKSEGRRPALHLFYGGRGRGDFHFLDRFERLGVKLHLATDDGSLGEAGTNVAAFERWSRDQRGVAPSAETGAVDSEYELLACGPTPMMRALVALGDPAPTQLSLEAHMACGVGVCRACAVARGPQTGPEASAPKRSAYAMVCTEGPCFEAREVQL